MGCCESSFLRETHPEEHPAQQQSIFGHNSQLQQGGGAASPAPGGAPTFFEFSLPDLKSATGGFSPDFIVSESGEKAPNHVFKGRLKSGAWIAVKKFTKLGWPEPKPFVVSRVSELEIGSCFAYCVFNWVASLGFNCLCFSSSWVLLK